MLYQTENRHGGDIYGGIALDFSANVSPLGTPRSVTDAIERALPELYRYPDPYCRTLVQTISEYEGVPKNFVLCGNGASELIYAYCGAVRPKRAMELAPTFSEYSLALRRTGCEIVRYALDQNENFDLRKDFLPFLAREKIDALFLCNPNNPTGRLIADDLLEEILRICREKNIALFVDECFLSLSDGGVDLTPSLSDFPQLFILKAFTKSFGMAGLRLGYGLSADEALLRKMSAAVPPWNVSTLAQAAGVAALGDAELLERNRAIIRAERPWLEEKLRKFGFWVCPSQVNYILFRGDVGLTEQLRARGVAIRDCANFEGLTSGWYRVAVRRHKENEQLIAAIRSVGRSERMAKTIMIQGTMSNAGKSLLAAGLCRVLKQDGYRVAPFKSQNMALNSFITKDGGEMGRAQVVQAEAAGIEPDVRMNPILLKPTTDVGSQVIVNGRVQGNLPAMEYYRRKRDFIPAVMEAYESLAREYDIIVIEGAGSPAEINLQENDIVNMGLARMVDAPVLLVGDIDRGGVFAQLYGTVALQSEEDRRRIKGVVVNKFRGDRAILEPGLKTLEELCGVPVAGVVPYLHVDIDDEDSLSERFGRDKEPRLIDIAVIRLPRISNFTDFSPFERYENVSLRYVERARDLRAPDMIVIPGTKSTIADLQWLRQSGLEASIQKAASGGTLVFGVCGGYQMLGRHISDPEQVEAAGVTEIDGMGLLPLETVFQGEKVQTQTNGVFSGVAGLLSELNGKRYAGYEIHMGRSEEARGALFSMGNVYGSYVHGIFDEQEVADTILTALCTKKGVSFESLGTLDARAYKERQYDLLADAVRAGLDMPLIYRILNREV